MILMFLSKLIFITPRRLHAACLILALTAYWDLLGHFEAFNSFLASWKKKGIWALSIFWTEELLSERKPFQGSFDCFTLKPEVAMT